MHDELRLYVVADGMGGHAGGDVASAAAVEQVLAMVRRGEETLHTFRRHNSDENRDAVRRVLEAAIQAATYMVFGIAEQDPGHKGMGTTMSALLFCSDVAFVGQVGDSRVYLVRNGVPFQITEDHTLVNMQLKAGLITAEEARTAPYQNMITRAVGVKDYVEVDTFDIDISLGDRFVLCSDGVHGYLEDDQQAKDLTTAATPDQVAHALVAHALESGGKDNATALVVDVG